MVDGEANPRSESSPEVAALLEAMKLELSAEVADVRVSDRLTESAVCLVAPDTGPDRQFEKLLSAAGRLDRTSKPVLEVNVQHSLIVSLAGLEDMPLRNDLAHLLLDEARILDGERPADARSFSERLGRIIAKALH